MKPTTPPTTIDAYISSFPSDVQAILQQIPTPELLDQEAPKKSSAEDAANLPSRAVAVVVSLVDQVINTGRLVRLVLEVYGHPHGHGAVWPVPIPQTTHRRAASKCVRRQKTCHIARHDAVLGIVWPTSPRLACCHGDPIQPMGFLYRQIGLSVDSNIDDSAGSDRGHNGQDQQDNHQFNQGKAR